MRTKKLGRGAKYVSNYVRRRRVKCRSHSSNVKQSSPVHSFYWFCCQYSGVFVQLHCLKKAFHVAPLSHACSPTCFSLPPFHSSSLLVSLHVCARECVLDIKLTRFGLCSAHNSKRVFDAFGVSCFFLCKMQLPYIAYSTRRSHSVLLILFHFELRTIRISKSCLWLRHRKQQRSTEWQAAHHHYRSAVFKYGHSHTHVLLIRFEFFNRIFRICPFCVRIELNTVALRYACVDFMFFFAVLLLSSIESND